uniref:Uncharacterized protein n=1 Tax=Anser cygnoides TaxID=8845 RepID=A0A8B9ES20_ANSCY
MSLLWEKKKGGGARQHPDLTSAGVSKAVPPSPCWKFCFNSRGSAVLPTVGLERAYLVANYCPFEMEPRASQLCNRFDACVCTGTVSGAAAICSTRHVHGILQDGCLICAGFGLQHTSVLPLICQAPSSIPAASSAVCV